MESRLIADNCILAFLRDLNVDITSQNHMYNAKTLWDCPCREINFQNNIKTIKCAQLCALSVQNEHIRAYEFSELQMWFLVSHLSVIRRVTIYTCLKRKSVHVFTTCHTTNKFLHVITAACIKPWKLRIYLLIKTAFRFGLEI
jgi:hypothetical protein